MICGRTGSGKTVFGAWLLSHAPFTTIPYVILNHKCDHLLANIPGSKTIGMHEALPKKPGIYQAFPEPADDDGLEAFLWRIRNRGNIGLVIDEGYEINPRSRAARSILTQGRSLQIPVIMLTQRPSWISRFLISEADYYVYFHLSDQDDRDRLKKFTPESWEIDTPTEPFYSRFYDVKRDAAALLAPVPEKSDIYSRFRTRLVPRKRWL